MLTIDLDTSLKAAMGIDGAICVAIVDCTSCMALGSASALPSVDPSIVAAAGTEVLRAKLRAMEILGVHDVVEDIMILLGQQYHLLHPLPDRTGAGLLVYLVLDRSRANLALAHHQLRAIADELEI